MLRPLLAVVFVLTAFAALAPIGSAVAICTHQEDATDLKIGDDPIAKVHCTTENISSITCTADVQVAQGGKVTRSSGCERIICTTYCDPYTTMAAQGPCTVATDASDQVLGDDALATVTCSTSPTIGYDCDGSVTADPYGVHRSPIVCQAILYCVTEPCPGGGPIRI